MAAEVETLPLGIRLPFGLALHEIGEGVRVDFSGVIMNVGGTRGGLEVVETLGDEGKGVIPPGQKARFKRRPILGLIPSDVEIRGT